MARAVWCGAGLRLMVLLPPEVAECTMTTSRIEADEPLPPHGGEPGSTSRTATHPCVRCLSISDGSTPSDRPGQGDPSSPAAERQVDPCDDVHAVATGHCRCSAARGGEEARS